MTFWTPDHIRAAAAHANRARWIKRPDDPSRKIDGLSTDTRTLAADQAFLALRGPNHDAHDHLQQAIDRRAALLIIDNESALPGPGALPADLGVIAVDDTTDALATIAAAYRQTLTSTRVVAVAGSNGKTTTTWLIRHILASAGLRGTAPRNSFNNHIGVPLTVLSAAPSDHYLLVEIGTSAPGEVARLASIASPDIAVITSIAHEHLANLKDLPTIAREQASLLSRLRPGGFAVVTADAPELAPLIPNNDRVVTFGFSPGAHVRIVSTEPSPDPDNPALAFTTADRVTATIPILADYGALCAAAALTVARRFNVPADTASRAIATFTPPPMRLNISRLRTPVGEVTLINDAYNANPASVRAAMQTLDRSHAARPGAARRVAMLADMGDLGEASARAHADIALDIAPHCDSLVLLGDETRITRTELARTAPSLDLHHTNDHRRAARVLLDILGPEDTLLLKGSRSMRLEHVLEHLAHPAPVPPAPAPDPPPAG